MNTQKIINEANQQACFLDAVMVSCFINQIVKFINQNQNGKTE